MNLIYKICDLLDLFFQFIKWIIDLRFQKRLIGCVIRNDCFSGSNRSEILSIYSVIFIVTSLFCYIFVWKSIIFIIFIIILALSLLFEVVKSENTFELYKKSEPYTKGYSNCLYSSSEFHHGIIFVIYKDPTRQLFIADIIDIMVKSFDEHIPFRIYPVRNEEDFRNVYNNPKIRWLWIFGHGQKDALGYQDNDEIKRIDYKNYQKNSNLLYIGQLHCNPGSGKSLVEINDLTADYDLTKMRFPFQNRCYVKGKINKFLSNNQNL